MSNPLHESDDLIQWRVGRLEEAVETMAIAAAEQERFNKEVIVFMASATTWGRVALLLYAIGQALVIAKM